jgi:hypothetical protein
LLEEETGGSFTDLTKVRQERMKELQSAGGGGAPDDTAPDQSVRALRNHGLFSKAEVALELAGWSPGARADIEVLPLVETEGLTPLLMVLNQRGNLAMAKEGELT